MAEEVVSGQDLMLALESNGVEVVQINTDEGCVPMGLVFKQKVDIEAMEEIGDILLRIRGTADCFTAMALGDWYNALTRDHGTKKEQITDVWGEGYSHQFRRFGYLANAFPVYYRVPHARLWHYVECAALPQGERVAWLRQYAGRKIKRQDIRDHLKAIQQKPLPEADEYEELDARAQKSVSPASQNSEFATDAIQEAPKPKPDPQWVADKFGAVGDAVQADMEAAQGMGLPEGVTIGGVFTEVTPKGEDFVPIGRLRDDGVWEPVLPPSAVVLSEDVYERLRRRAESAGKSVVDFATDLIRYGFMPQDALMSDLSWIMEEKGQTSGEALSAALSYWRKEIARNKNRKR